MSCQREKVCQFVREIGGVLARLLLGGMFIYTGFNKAFDPVGFLKLLRQYELFELPIVLNSIAAALPWFEIFCGLMLVCGVGVRGSAALLVTLLVPFTVIVLRRAFAIQALTGVHFCAVKFDCGCGTGEVYICNKLIENCLMILLAVWLINGGGRKLALRYTLFRSGDV